jgi:hypothetical protein
MAALETREQRLLAKRISLSFAALGLVILLPIIAGLLWLCFGDGFVTGRQLVGRFGFEMPSAASNIVVISRKEPCVVGFRLTPKEARNFVAHPLPDYEGWRQQGADELLPSFKGMPGRDSHNVMIDKMPVEGGTLWVFANLSTGQCFAYTDVEFWND